MVIGDESHANPFTTDSEGEHFSKYFSNFSKLSTSQTSQKYFFFRSWVDRSNADVKMREVIFLSGLELMFSNLLHIFYHLNVSVREVFSGNFSFTCQFSLILWLFKVSGIACKFLVCRFFLFPGTPTFR